MDLLKKENKEFITANQIILMKRLKA